MYRQPNGNEIDNFVSDLINDIICRIEIKQDLNPLHEKMLKTLVEV